MFYRKWKDPGSDWEEVSEEDARNALSGNYRDVDLAIEGMKAGGNAPTMSAVYAWSDTGIPD